MSVESRWLAARLTRRQFVQGAAAATSALLFARLTRLARALEVPPPGYLSDAEYRAIDAMTARLVPTGETVGAHDAGVADYIQGLLSIVPGGDANGDGRISAADVTAVVAALGSDGGSADVDGSGHVDRGDLTAVQRAIFGSALVDPPAFSSRPLFGRGPFSGRNPYPDAATGTPSNEFPANQFAEPVPLPRVKRIAWTVRLLGAAAAPEVSGNPLATTLPDVDLRRRYREGIAALQALSQDGFGADYDALAEADQDAVLAQLKTAKRSFYDLVVDHTIEGLLSAPEYGGNRDGVGWQLVGFDGDSQPLGYTIFDSTLGDYRERPDKPNSTLDADDDCSGFSEDVAAMLRSVLVRLARAEEFPATECFRG